MGEGMNEVGMMGRSGDMMKVGVVRRIGDIVGMCCRMTGNERDVERVYRERSGRGEGYVRG